MKSYTANLLNSFNRQYAYHTHLIDFLKTEVFALKKHMSFIASNVPTASYSAHPYVEDSTNQSKNENAEPPSLFRSVERQRARVEQITKEKQCNS